MKKIIYILIGIICFIVFPVSDARPQFISISSSPHPLGSGARALGMGNAFIAVADDATAASWNPGGLIQLETPEISMVLYNAIRTEDYVFMSHPETESDERTNEFNINYLSAAYPFTLFGKNMVASLNYQRLYDMKQALKLNQHLRGSFIDITHRISYKADGGLKALSPSYAIQVTEDLSFGFTLNFWTDAMGGRNGWREETRSLGEGTLATIPVISTEAIFEEYENASGFNFNLGVLWNITEMITFGATFKSPAKVDTDHSFVSKSTQEFPTLGMFSETNPPMIEDEVELNFPLSYGAGLAFRFSDSLTASFDVYRTEWGNYYFRNEDGSRKSPIDGRPRSESHINATTQVHLGAEYLFILEKTVIPVRGGVFYDPEPSEDSSEDFYGFSFGTGVSLGDVVIDAAYQYRWGRDSGNRVIDSEADVDHHTFYLSAIYHF